MGAVPSLSEALRLVRQRQRKTMVEFADLLGLTQGAISQYESGKIKPSRPVLLLYLQLAEGLEKGPIYEALGVEENLREGWGPGELDAALADFEEYTRADRSPQRASRAAAPALAAEVRAILAERIPVDPVLVAIVRHWHKHWQNPSAREFFQHVLAYLEVELTRVEAAERKKKRKGN